MAKLVIFDLGGVIITSPMFAFQKYAWEKGIPSDFLLKCFASSVDKLERGQMSLSEFYPEVDRVCKEHALEEGINLPESFRFQDLLEEFFRSVKVIPEMLNASTVLRKNGLKTCVLTNNWTDDTGRQNKALVLLYHYFDDVFESCKLGFRKPEPAIYTHTCTEMGVEPTEAILLDDSPVNLKTAATLGMRTVLVKDPFSALRALKEITGIDVFQELAIPPCSPDSAAHCYVSLKTGIKMHFVDMGQGPVLILLHGFPELWYVWKYQIAALATAGYRVIAPDLRGMGQTSSPYDINAYGEENICADIIALMNSLCISQATLIGRDFGGLFAWSLALHYAERFNAVINMTPFFPTSPSFNPQKKLQENPGVFQYQVYFQKEGVAEAELEKDTERTFTLLLRSAKDMVEINTANVLDRGGLLVGLPEKMDRSCMITEEDLKYFVEMYTRTRFRGPLNWYRTVEKDWKWKCKVAGRKVQQPSLMITAGKDGVVQPKLSTGMEDWVCNLDRAHIEDASHWMTLDCPLELNKIMVAWLNKVHSKMTDSSKL